MNKQITLSLEKAKELYKKDSVMDELLLANFSKEELEKKELPKSWEELGEIRGFEISAFSSIHKYGPNITITDKKVYATEKQAKSALAMAQLSQLMAVYNEGWEPDWTDTSEKFIIERNNNYIVKNHYNGAHMFLSFKTAKIRDEFLNNFEDLIKEYFEL